MVLNNSMNFTFQTGKYCRLLKMGHCPVNCAASSSNFNPKCDVIPTK